jgi:hypothetical protein
MPYIDLGIFYSDEYKCIMAARPKQLPNDEIRCPYP